VASQGGYHVTLCNADEDPQKEKGYLEELYKRKVDGIILSATGKNLSLVKKLIRSGMPIVLVDRKIDKLDTTQVVVDNKEGAYEAVKHLIKLGYQRIGVINGIKGIWTSEQRFAGYLDALEESELKIKPELIKYGDFRVEGSKKAMVEFLGMKNPPEAVFVTNEAMTTGALLAMKEKMMIPSGHLLSNHH